MQLKFIVALVLALCTALGVKWFESHQLAQDLTLASERNQTLSDGLKRSTSDLEHVREAEQQRQSDRDVLQKKQRELVQLAESRLTIIRNLTDENEELRAWSAKPLPDAVVRLYERPSFQSAADYLEYLRYSNTLHTAGDKSKE